MAELNPAQQAHLRASLGRVQQLLFDALRVLEQSEHDGPFSKHVPDASPVQRKVVADYIARARARMHKALDAFRVPPSSARTGAVNGARTTILLAEIALEEIEPRAMRGYGVLSKEAERELGATTAELLELLEQIDGYLAQGPARDVSERLRRLENSSIDARFLAELESIISAHGLTELRAMLEMLMERFESHRLEVAAFGRTNAGKSSLLNHLLMTKALPVGVTPVTSVPLRIMYGKKPWGRATFADAIPESFGLGRLAEFVDAHYNPSNVRHVVRIAIELPAPILETGLVLSDTPGLASLASASAQETLAYLPRCDLGILLIDAASSLTYDDVAIVDALHRAGASVMVLVTKADLLSAEDRLITIGYLRQELETRTQLELPIHCISVVGPGTTLCDAWRDDVLVPWLRAREQNVQMSLRRKLGVLRDATIAALERRLEPARKPRTASEPGRAESAERVLAEGLADLNAFRRERRPYIEDAQLMTREVLDEVAHNAAVLWTRSAQREIDVSGLLGASLASRAGAAAKALVRDMARLRARMATALADAVRAAHLPQTGEELPRAAGMPAFDASLGATGMRLQRPTLAIGLRLLRQAARRQLGKRDLMSDMTRRLLDYEERLAQWRWQTIEELRRSFCAQRDLLVAGREQGTGQYADAAAMRADLERLRRLGSAAANEAVGTAP